MRTADEVIRRQTLLHPRRFDPVPGGRTMTAVVTTGHGGADRLEVREVAVPRLEEGEVLVRVLAAGVNATDVNTRVGWYAGGGWSVQTLFPLIQGTDCCGVVDEAGASAALLNRRVLVRPCMRPRGFGSLETVWMGSDFDGAFAQFVRVPASEVFPVESDLPDAELGAMPCTYGTALNMLRRAGVRAGEDVLVTGASGGVGSAAVQLAALLGATVTALAAEQKAEAVSGLGAARVLDRERGLDEVLGDQSVDVVVDNVSGPGFEELIGLLRRGGRYVSSGAIAGPQVGFDKRTFYLRDLTLLGCTAWDEPVFPELVERIGRGEVRPLVAATLPLERIAEVQAEFLERRHVGKLVLVPPA
jgi:NADPH:quinone reductase-like Zn-dependent oxidoreductase